MKYCSKRLKDFFVSGRLDLWVVRRINEGSQFGGNDYGNVINSGTYWS